MPRHQLFITLSLDEKGPTDAQAAAMDEKDDMGSCGNDNAYME